MNEQSTKTRLSVCRIKSRNLCTWAVEDSRQIQRSSSILFKNSCFSSIDLSLKAAISFGNAQPKVKNPKKLVN